MIEKFVSLVGKETPKKKKKVKYLLTVIDASSFLIK
jgi:hypothetical protein